MLFKLQYGQYPNGEMCNFFFYSFLMKGKRHHNIEMKILQRWHGVKVILSNHKDTCLVVADHSKNQIILFFFYYDTSQSQNLSKYEQNIVFSISCSLRKWYDFNVLCWESVVCLCWRLHFKTKVSY